MMTRTSFFIRPPLLLLTTVFAVSIFFMISSCKKLELVRKIGLTTYAVNEVYSNAVKAEGSFIDLGQGNITDHGFVVSTISNPNINVSLGLATTTGDFSALVTGLQPGKTYILRSYATNSVESTVFGESREFTTPNTSTVTLSYDNGVNYSGITYGGNNFDVGIRFTASQLQPYMDMWITQVRFFPKSALASYAIEVYSGSTLAVFQTLTTGSLNINAWNTITLESPFLITGNDVLTIGYWVYSYPVSEYPAGIDAGPAIQNYGDLISGDNGVTWQSLATTYSINSNWNIQVIATNSVGKNHLLEPAALQKPVSYQNSATGNFPTSQLPKQ